MSKQSPALLAKAARGVYNGATRRNGSAAATNGMTRSFVVRPSPLKLTAFSAMTNRLMTRSIMGKRIDINVSLFMLYLGFANFF